MFWAKSTFYHLYEHYDVQPLTSIAFKSISTTLFRAKPFFPAVLLTPSIFFSFCSLKMNFSWTCPKLLLASKHTQPWFNALTQKGHKHLWAFVFLQSMQDFRYYFSLCSVTLNSAWNHWWTAKAKSAKYCINSSSDSKFLSALKC